MDSGDLFSALLPALGDGLLLVVARFGFLSQCQTGLVKVAM
jgi:hypothetical protein